MAFVVDWSDCWFTPLTILQADWDGTFIMWPQRRGATTAGGEKSACLEIASAAHGAVNSLSMLAVWCVCPHTR